MYIPKRTFLYIMLLFALIPISVNWRLLLFGEKAIGTVVERTISSPFINCSDNFSLIEFTTQDGKDMLIYGPENIKYPIGKKIKIRYKKKEPEKFVMITAAGFLLTNKIIIPIIALVFWVSFYLSFGQDQNRKQSSTSYDNYKKYIKKHMK